MKSASHVYQLKIALKDSKPSIWRRVLVTDQTILETLHEVIQDVFGWEDYHLHRFERGGVIYDNPEFDDSGERDSQDATQVRISDLELKEGSRFIYVYDYGDNWEHTIVVEKIFSPEKSMKLPKCIDGKRACPPEDVGGIPGYLYYLEVIANPDHEEYERYLEWRGANFDPDAFDQEAANWRLNERQNQIWQKGYIYYPVEDWLEHHLEQTTSAGWFKHISLEDEKNAEGLVLRKDVAIFLDYLENTTVTGTQATGNLPLKSMQELAPRLICAPKLEFMYDSTLIRHKTETDVWAIFFIHLLVRGMRLINGGPSRRWKINPKCELYRSLSPASQVWVLFSTWWNLIDWQVSIYYQLFENYVPVYVKSKIVDYMLKIPVGDTISFNAFMDDLIAEMKWTGMERPGMLYHTRDAIEKMVIIPLEAFGMLTTVYEMQKEQWGETRILNSFTLTQIGQKFLRLLSPGEWY